MDEKTGGLSHFFLIYKPPVLLFLQDNADFFLGERHRFPLPAGTEISGKKHCDTDEKDNRGDSLLPFQIQESVHDQKQLLDQVLYICTHGSSPLNDIDFLQNLRM